MINAIDRKRSWCVCVWLAGWVRCCQTVSQWFSWHRLLGVGSIKLGAGGKRSGCGWSIERHQSMSILSIYSSVNAKTQLSITPPNRKLNKPEGYQCLTRAVRFAFVSQRFCFLHFAFNRSCTQEFTFLLVKNLHKNPSESIKRTFHSRKGEHCTNLQIIFSAICRWFYLRCRCFFLSYNWERKNLYFAKNYFSRKMFIVFVATQPNRYYKPEREKMCVMHECSR